MNLLVQIKFDSRIGSVFSLSRAVRVGTKYSLIGLPSSKSAELDQEVVFDFKLRINDSNVSLDLGVKELYAGLDSLYPGVYKIIAYKADIKDEWLAPNPSTFEKQNLTGNDNLLYKQNSPTVMIDTDSNSEFKPSAYQH